jgi:polyisoprenoid-binding protein YceI
MKSITKSLLLFCLAGLSTQAVAGDTYTIDPAHSTIGFAVTHMVISTVHGKFKDFIGAVELDEHVELPTSRAMLGRFGERRVQSASGTVQTKSIDTGIEERDKHLRSAEFFDADKYPTITFQSKRVKNKNGQRLLVGDFTMHGVTKEITVPVTVKGPIKDPWGNNRIGLQAKTKVNRKDYGMKFNQLLETGGAVVGDEVEIEINAEATKPAAK